jgi:hypothetical protein
VPFVIRADAIIEICMGEMKEDNPLYVLVGEAYIHGIMHGEVMDRQDFEWRRLFFH